MIINLPDLDLALSAGSLAFPNGTIIKGDLEILNTNSNNLTLLTNVSNTSAVTLTINKNLVISGNSKVVLATSDESFPETSYLLQVGQDFIQSDGNFSLQDFNTPLGASTLAIRGSFTQTAGNFERTVQDQHRKPFIVEVNGRHSSDH